MAEVITDGQLGRPCRGVGPHIQSPTLNARIGVQTGGSKDLHAATMSDVPNHSVARAADALSRLYVSMADDEGNTSAVL